MNEEHPPKQTPIWIVWGPSGRTNPRVRFENREAAKQAARDLAVRNPGQEFFAVAATDRFLCDNVQHAELDPQIDGVPF